MRLKPTEIIDLGDRLVLFADMPMRAQVNGVAYLNHSEALEAVGLS